MHAAMPMWPKDNCGSRFHTGLFYYCNWCSSNREKWMIPEMSPKKEGRSGETVRKVLEHSYISQGSQRSKPRESPFIAVGFVSGMADLGCHLDWIWNVLKWDFPNWITEGGSPTLNGHCLLMAAYERAWQKGAFAFWHLPCVSLVSLSCCCDQLLQNQCRLKTIQKSSRPSAPYGDCWSI